MPKLQSQKIFGLILLSVMNISSLQSHNDRCYSLHRSYPSQKKLFLPFWMISCWNLLALVSKALYAVSFLSIKISTDKILHWWSQYQEQCIHVHQGTRHVERNFPARQWCLLHRILSYGISLFPHPFCTVNVLSGALVSVLMMFIPFSMIKKEEL